MSVVEAYCRAFQKSGLAPIVFARRYYLAHPDRVLEILEIIGSWPSSEPELRALQQVYP